VSRRTYADAGVSLATAEAVVERLRRAVESTGARGFGTFAGLYPLDERRFLAASTDGVGSKLMLSRRAGRLRDAGRDLGAHCVNDVLCSGAEPLFLLGSSSTRSRSSSRDSPRFAARRAAC
jgi:phosphoribosylformylglycinamidine cyclo-ligase